MLVDVKLNAFSSKLTEDDPNRTVRAQEGVYLTSWFNFELEFRDCQNYKLDFPGFSDPEFSCYGVCDSPEQLLAKLPEEITTGPRKFVISVTGVRKEDQPPDGGWRWEKWGPYIGEMESKADYLYDEPDIDMVCIYHIYEVE